MKIISKLFLPIMFVALTISCSKEKANANPETEMNVSASDATMMAEASTASVSANVYNLESVVPGKGGSIPDFTWTENGKSMKFSEVAKNKVVFINFWGTWCPPCRAELPGIISIDKELAGKDFLIIGINVNERAADPISHVAKFAGDKGIKYRNFIDTKGELAYAFGGVRAVPTTYIVDKSGNISETLVGGRSKEIFLESINKALGK